jgi:hypothetical protein
MAALALLLTVTGCNTVSTSSHQFLGGATYPPSDPALIQILRTEPKRPHVQLGQVQAQPSSSSVGNQEIEQALQKVAAKMGADAVVVVQDTTQVTGAYVSGPLWARSVTQVTGRVIVGVAIKYTGP